MIIVRGAKKICTCTRGLNQRKPFEEGKLRMESLPVDSVYRHAAYHHHPWYVLLLLLSTATSLLTLLFLSPQLRMRIWGLTLHKRFPVIQPTIIKYGLIINPRQKAHLPDFCLVRNLFSVSSKLEQASASLLVQSVRSLTLRASRPRADSGPSFSEKPTSSSSLLRLGPTWKYSQKYESCNCSKFLPQWCWERGAACTTSGCSCGVCQKRTDFPQRICWMWSKVESHWRGTQPAPSRTWSFSGGHSVGTSLVQPSWWESWRWSSPGALSPPFASQHGFEATPTAPSFPSSAFPHSPSKRRKEVLTRFPTTRGLPFAPTCSHKVRALCKASKRHAESGWSGGVLFANFSTNSGYSVTYMHGNVWYFSIVADVVDIVHCLTLFHYPFNRFEKVEWQRHALHPLVSLALA